MASNCDPKVGGVGWIVSKFGSPTLISLHKSPFRLTKPTKNPQTDVRGHNGSINYIYKLIS